MKTSLLWTALLLAAACKSKEPAPAPAPVEPAPKVVPKAPDPEPARAPDPREAIRALKNEPTNGVTLGMSPAEVTTALGAPKGKTPLAKTADPLEQNRHETVWTWPGIKATLRGPAEDQLTLREIKFSPPSAVKTARGIGIGSTRTDVQKAYENIAEPDFARDPRFFVAGMHSDRGISGFVFNFDRDSDVGPQDPGDKVISFEIVGGAD